MIITTLLIQDNNKNIKNCNWPYKMFYISFKHQLDMVMDIYACIQKW